MVVTSPKTVLNEEEVLHCNLYLSIKPEEVPQEAVMLKLSTDEKENVPGPPGIAGGTTLVVL